MRKIHQLPQDVIAKIAAGEVIERPVYAVKELIENALDAKAKHITVDIVDAGLKQITVTDNGEGMTKEDLLEAFKLHTTSKLHTEEELASVSTMGFRGEALASLAAISHLTIQSRTNDTKGGTTIEILDGKMLKVSAFGMPVGTQVHVGNLFHSVPGRKKFLKSNRTEFRHIIDMVTRFAFAHPTVHFALSHNKKNVFDLPQTTQLERIRKLLGETLFNNLLSVTFETEYISISGFITKPQATTQTKQQYLTINKRNVHDKIIASAITSAYGTLLDTKSYPIFVLSISVPFEHVDSNVHPRKESVRFVDTQMIYDATYRAVMQTLTDNNIIYFTESFNGISVRDDNPTNWKKGTTKSFAAKLLKENQIPWDIRPIEELHPQEIIQMHNLYLVTQTKNGIAIIDQHAAHERILYEQFLEAFKKQKEKTPSYNFAKPVIIDLSYTESELVKEHLETLQKIGFSLEYFKDNAFLLHEMPLVFQDRDPRKLLSELLEDIHQKQKVKDIDTTSQRMIAYLACRAAVKAGESLTKKQSKDLIDKLQATKNNTTCPHGRPTRTILDIDMIHRMFKRK